MRILTLISLLICLSNSNSKAQDIIYGQNEKAGKYVISDDAKIYYEVYGKGKPIILLHGGFAYINQFKKYIQTLSPNFKVIVIAQRGYGKSEIGSTQFSHELCAKDVKNVILNESKEKAIIIGFSSGANFGYMVAYKYPNLVDRLITMGSALDLTDDEKYDGKSLSKSFQYYRPEFKRIMPQPDRWNELMEKIAVLWNERNYLPIDQLSKIKCPVLLLFGDRDHYYKPEQIAKVYSQFVNGQLAIIPNSGHIDVSPFNTVILEQYIIPFIKL